MLRGRSISRSRLVVLVNSAASRGRVAASFAQRTFSLAAKSMSSGTIDRVTACARSRAAREHLRAGRQRLSRNSRRTAGWRARCGAFGISRSGRGSTLFMRKARRVVAAHRQRHQVGLQREKTRCGAPATLPAMRQKELLQLPSWRARSCCRLFQSKRPSQQHVLAVGREGQHRGVQVLLVIEIGLATKARYSGSSPTFDPSSICRMPPARKRREIDVYHHRIVSRQALEHGGRGEGPRAVPDHASERRGHTARKAARISSHARNLGVTNRVSHSR